MEFIAIIVLTLLLSMIILSLRYYLDLFESKDNYTKSELTDILPYIQAVSGNILKKYSIPVLSLTTIVTFIISFYIPRLSDNYFTNSVIIYTAFFFGLPAISKFLQNQSTETDSSIKLIIYNYLISNHKLISFIFGLGTLTSFTFNRITYHNINFIYFIVNLTIAVILLEISLKSLNRS